MYYISKTTKTCLKTNRNSVPGQHLHRSGEFYTGADFFRGIYRNRFKQGPISGGLQLVNVPVKRQYDHIMFVNANVNAEYVLMLPGQQHKFLVVYF